MKIDINNIDCLEGLKKIPSNSVQLVVTSPPYNMGDDRYYKNYEDNKSSEEYVKWLDEINKEIYRVLKNDGVYCLNMSYNRNSPSEYIKVVNNCLNCKLILRETVSWIKKGMPLIEIRNFTRDFEFIFILTKCDEYKTNQKRKQIISNVWKIKNLGTQKINSKSNFDDSLNNATFPLEFPKKCIELFTSKGDLVLDQFSGTGTTAIASIQTERNFIGFELDKETYLYSKERIENNQKNKLFDWLN